MFNILLLLPIFLIFSPVEPHAYLLHPPNRASRWRFNNTAPINYEDNELFCGGMMVQFGENDGKCGMCGDNYTDPTPRTYELGSKIFGEGVIVAKYIQGQNVTFGIQVTANHLGYFIFNICNIDEYKKESEECFEKIPLQLPDGSYKYYVSDESKLFTVSLKLSQDLHCLHCVLQWTYISGNSVGVCDDGTEAMGCGPQETFRNCADISIQ